MKHGSLSSILKGTGAEMFVSDGEALIVCERRVHGVNTMPGTIKDKLIKFIENDPKMNEAYTEMAGSSDRDAKIEQCIKCRFSKLDGLADIDEAGNIVDREYSECPKRGGECRFEGVGCNAFDIGNGNKISDREMRVLQLCYMEDKDIAERLFLSTFTVNTHLQNIRRKTGISKKPILALWAEDKGIINQEIL